MMNKAFNTPILLLIFKRKESTLLVLDEIRKAKPKYLFIGADGPRANNKDDAIKCALTRNAVLKAIDWDCEVKTLFRDENLGCGFAPAEAITWFFRQVEYGIILEDDILASESFFPFCEELLIKYRFDEKVMSIAGTNFLSQHYKSSESYYFTNYAGGWGWASWRRAWDYYDYNIKEWGKEEIKEKIKSKFSKEGYAFWEEAFNLVYDKNLDHIWDYQWAFSKMVKDGIGIIPASNLTKNIGIGIDATHTFDASEDILKSNINQQIQFPLIHPNDVTINIKFDNAISQKFFSIKPVNRVKFNIFQKLINKQSIIKKYIKLFIFR